jgi:hypothetical protein
VALTSAGRCAFSFLLPSPFLPSSPLSSPHSDSASSPSTLHSVFPPHLPHTRIASCVADETLLSGLKGDPQESSLWLVSVGPSLPSFVRNTIAWLLETVAGDKSMARLLRASRGKSVTELQAWQHQRCVLSFRICSPLPFPVLTPASLGWQRRLCSRGSQGGEPVFFSAPAFFSSFRRGPY